MNANKDKNPSFSAKQVRAEEPIACKIGNVQRLGQRQRGWPRRSLTPLLSARTSVASDNDFQRRATRGCLPASLSKRSAMFVLRCLRYAERVVRPTFAHWSTDCQRFRKAVLPVLAWSFSLHARITLNAKSVSEGWARMAIAHVDVARKEPTRQLTFFCDRL